MSWGRRIGLALALAGAVTSVPALTGYLTANSAGSALAAVRDTGLKPLSDTDAKTYASAFAAAAQGRWSRAHGIAAGAKSRELAKVLGWLDMSRPGAPVDFAEISAFRDSHPTWPGRSVLIRRAEEAMTERVPDETVLKWFAANPPQTTDGHIRLISALMSRGDTKRAETLIRETWINESFGTTQERQFLRAYRKYLTKDDHAARLDRLLWDGNYVQARRTVKMVDKGVQHLAMAKIALRSFRGGVDWHIRQVPPSLREDLGLQYERARWRRRKDRDDEAYEILKDVPASAPYAELWWNERAIVARRLLEKGHVSEAYRLVAANGLKEGAQYAEAEWMAGWISLRFLREPKQALVHFERIREAVNYPISKARAAYWAGRAASDAGNTKTASKYFSEASLHDTTYYGQLAAARIGRTIALRASDASPTKAQKTAFEKDERVRIVLMLNQIGAADHIRPFLDSLADGDNAADHQMAAELANRIGRRDLAVRAGRKAYLAGAALPDVAYPVMEMPRGNPEQALLHAIARQESNFDHTAVSSAGALGLMQLMPETARGVARNLQVHYSRGKLTEEPDYNIRLGRAYLGEMLDRFDGSYILAIAAYNAGPGAAARWLKTNGDPRNGDVDPIDWIEMIPYRETRNYVQRVIENLQVYRARLGESMVAEAIVKDLKR